ncbi:MAG: hypothetical protein KGL67_01040 [Patescibacteria group bacterium]|nr:hypothetical protein [Patescibacteria group bacterium]
MSIFISILIIVASICLIIVSILLITVLLYILALIFTLKGILEKMEKNIGFATKTALKTFSEIKNSRAVRFLLNKKKK